MKAKDITMLFVLAALWGGSFLFMRIGAPVLGPFVLIELRVLLAAMTLVVVAMAIRHRIRLHHKWWQYLVLGATNAALPYTLIAYAELRLDAGLAAILNATTPLFTALVAWLWIKDPFAWRTLSGIVLGVFGVGVVVGWGAGAHGASLWLSASFSLVAAVSYGVAGVFSSRHFKGEKPLDMAIGQQLGATLLLLPFILAMLPHRMPSHVVILSVFGLAILCTAAAFLFYFALIHRVGPVKTLAVTFLVPVFGVIWGGLFLGEAVTVRLVLGLVIILASVAVGANVRGKQPTVNGHRPRVREKDV